MAWIESHQSIRMHPKTLHLMQLLHLDKAAVIGHLHCLWWWALDYAPTGDVTNYTAINLSLAADYQPLRGKYSRNRQQFVDALVAAGYIDKTPDGHLVLHDWNEYAGKWVEKRASDARRKRDVRKTSAGHPPDGAGTVTNRTNSTVPPISPKGDSVSSSTSQGSEGHVYVLPPLVDPKQKPDLRRPISLVKKEKEQEARNA